MARKSSNNAGALAQGLVAGYAMGWKMDQEEQQTKRRNEINEREEERHRALMAEHERKLAKIEAAERANERFAEKWLGWKKPAPEPGISPLDPNHDPKAAFGPNQEAPTAGIMRDAGLLPPQQTAQQQAPGLAPTEGNAAAGIAQTMRNQSPPAGGPATGFEAVGFGFMQNPDVLSNPEAMRDMAKMFAEEGVYEEMMPWLKAAQSAAKENGIKAALALDAGNPDESFRLFNTTGTYAMAERPQRVGKDQWSVKFNNGESWTGRPLDLLKILDPKLGIEVGLKAADDARADKQLEANTQHQAAELELRKQGLADNKEHAKEMERQGWARLNKEEKDAKVTETNRFINEFFSRNALERDPNTGRAVTDPETGKTAVNVDRYNTFYGVLAELEDVYEKVHGRPPTQKDRQTFAQRIPSAPLNDPEAMPKWAESLVLGKAPPKQKPPPKPEQTDKGDDSAANGGGAKKGEQKVRKDGKRIISWGEYKKKRDELDGLRSQAARMSRESREHFLNTRVRPLEEEIAGLDYLD